MTSTDTGGKLPRPMDKCPRKKNGGTADVEPAGPPKTRLTLLHGVVGGGRQGLLSLLLLWLAGSVGCTAVRKAPWQKEEVSRSQ